MSARGARIGLAVAAVLLVAFGAARLRMRTDITRFLPSPEAAELGALSRLLTESELARTLVLCVGADQTGTAVAAARTLAADLEGHPEVAWVRGGVDPDLPRHVFETYFPRRFAFFSDDPEHEVPALLSDAALRERARRVRAELSLPSGALQKRIVPEDPIGAFPRILRRFQAMRPALEVVDGQLVSADGRFAILFVGTHAAPFDATRQAPFLAFVEERVAAIASELGEPLVLERSGVSLFAVSAERHMRGDIVRIALASVAGVTLLFLFFFGSVGAFGRAMVPGGIGILSAIDLQLLLFGEIDGLTLAFGTSLIGVAIDYPIHLLNHRALLDDAGARATSRRLRGSLSLGAATTMASFAGLGLTDFPGFREIALFAVVGIAVALAVTLFVMPALLEGPMRVPDRARRAARALGRGVAAAAARPARLALLPALVLVVAAAGLPRLQWNDDLSALTSFEPGLRAEDARVRERVASLESSRVVLALAEGPEQAVLQSDRVHERLAPLLADGRLEAIRSLHGLVWSPELQRRSHAAVVGSPDLADRTQAAFREAGFREGALAPFRTALEAEAPEVLRLEDLRGSPLSPLLDPLVLDLGERLAVVTYLRGAADLAPVREALSGLPDVRIFEQRSFVNEIYAAFRARTVRQIGIGSALVVAVLALRYRRLRPTLAAFLPSVLTAAALLGLFGLLGIQAHLVHVVSLLMVMGMGVDYGIFLVDSAHERRALDATLLSLLVSCGTTVFVFGALVVSSQEALRAMGLTTGLGVAFSFLLAPVVFAVLRPAQGHEGPA